MIKDEFITLLDRYEAAIIRACRADCAASHHDCVARRRDALSRWVHVTELRNCLHTAIKELRNHDDPTHNLDI